MGAVDRAVVGEDARDLDHLLARRRVRRRIEQPRAQPRRTRVQRLLEPAAHDGDLACGGGAVEAVHRAEAQGRVPDLGENVDRRRVGIERGEIVGEAREVMLGAVADQVGWGRRHAPGREGCEADTAIAGDHRGHPLARLARHQRVAEHPAVVVGVDVDETRRQRQAARRDLGCARRGADRADGNDAVVAHRNVALARRRAGALDQPCAADDQIDAPIVAVHVAASYGPVPLNQCLGENSKRNPSPWPESYCDDPVPTRPKHLCEPSVAMVVDASRTIGSLAHRRTPTTAADPRRTALRRSVTRSASPCDRNRKGPRVPVHPGN